MNTTTTTSNFYHGTNDDLRYLSWIQSLNVTLDSEYLTKVETSITSCELSLPNQRVVVHDAERTRSDQPSFRTPVVQSRIVRLLTAFCKFGHGFGSNMFLENTKIEWVPYRQGLNELLAPFLMLQTTEPLNDSVIMGLFSRLIAVYVPRVFADTNDSDFTALQCSLRLLSLLLQYHDPKLHQFIEQFDVPPELYATPWFLTLFGRSMSRTDLFTLWDLLIASAKVPGPVILHAVAVALLMSHRDTILATRTKGTIASDLPIVMSKLNFENSEHIRRVFSHALEILAQTPISFRRLIYNVCYSGGTSALRVSHSLLTRLEQRVCVKISVEEVLVGAGTRFAVPDHFANILRSSIKQRNLRSIPVVDPTSPSYAFEDGSCRGSFELLDNDENFDVTPRYMILDVRSKSEYEFGGHLPTAFHLDEALLEDPEKLDALLQTFAGLKGVHLALMGAGDINQWYHAPVPPTSLMSDNPALMNEEEQPLTPTFSKRNEAARVGLDPVSGNENDDYGIGDRCREFVALFLQRGFTYVSEVEGGFTSLHQHQAHFLDKTLSFHDKQYCMVCSGGAAASLYAGRNALERGILLQDATPFRLKGAIVKASNSSSALRDMKDLISPPLSSRASARSSSFSAMSVVGPLSPIATMGASLMREISTVPPSTSSATFAATPTPLPSTPRSQTDTSVNTNVSSVWAGLTSGISSTISSVLTAPSSSK
jgi:hypothetical protein